jgi:D-alanine-D-alanine ligase
VFTVVDKKFLIVIFARKIFIGENILSSLKTVRLNVALTFNVKPESDNTFKEILSPNPNFSLAEQKKGVDTFAEWDTWSTIKAVKEALEEYSAVSLIEADDNAFENLRALRPDIVFNIAEGFNRTSREAQIPAILDMLNIPYTGSDPLTLSICLDKARTKEILTYHNIPNAKFYAASSTEELGKIDFNYPLIVKPVSEGSGKGIFSTSFVNNINELTKEVERITVEYDQEALIEEFLPGREFTVAVLGNDDEAEVLPVIEIDYKEFPDGFIPIYSYEAKWILDTKENPLDLFTCPAKIDKALEEEIKSTVLKAYKKLRCRDWSRIDVRLDKNGVVNIIEINPLPGILPDPNENSCFPKAARTAGVNYSEMINRVLYSAAKRYRLI